VAPPCDCGSAFVDLGLAIASSVAVNDNALALASISGLH